MTDVQCLERLKWVSHVGTTEIKKQYDWHNMSKNQICVHWINGGQGEKNSYGHLMTLSLPPPKLVCDNFIRLYLGISSVSIIWTHK